MPKVLCTLPNASEDIGGVKFVSHAKGMLSEEVSDAVAKRLATIPGYEIIGATPPQAPVIDESKAAERAALAAKAEALGLKVKGNWSLERLASEVADAEKAAKPAEVAAAE